MKRFILRNKPLIDIYKTFLEYYNSFDNFDKPSHIPHEYVSGVLSFAVTHNDTLHKNIRIIQSFTKHIFHF